MYFRTRVQIPAPPPPFFNGISRLRRRSRRLHCARSNFRKNSFGSARLPAPPRFPSEKQRVQPLVPVASPIPPRFSRRRQRRIAASCSCRGLNKLRFRVSRVRPPPHRRTGSVPQDVNHGLHACTIGIALGQQKTVRLLSVSKGPCDSRRSLFSSSYNSYKFRVPRGCRENDSST
jgi:hypothetical protein